MQTNSSYFFLVVIVLVFIATALKLIKLKSKKSEITNPTFSQKVPFLRYKFSSKYRKSIDKISPLKDSYDRNLYTYRQKSVSIKHF